MLLTLGRGALEEFTVLQELLELRWRAYVSNTALHKGHCECCMLQLGVTNRTDLYHAL